MASFTPTQCRSLIFRYLLVEGWLPRGTTAANWRDVTIRRLQIDDPPLPSDQDLQKRRISLDLQNLFFVLGGELESPIDQLRDGALTLNQLAQWCHGHQGQ
ncbi:MAG TPA: hypothetical protein VFY42_05555 [Gemmatimonadales bacterium]|nr:hypothetical protein [Gemmatimonadales bacterium]